MKLWGVQGDLFSGRSDDVGSTLARVEDTTSGMEAKLHALEAKVLQAEERRGRGREAGGAEQR